MTRGFGVLLPQIHWPNATRDLAVSGAHSTLSCSDVSLDGLGHGFGVAGVGLGRKGQQLSFDRLRQL